MAHLRVGLIGCGTIATSAHVPALQRLRSMVRVLRVCDIRQEAAQAVAASLGCAWSTEYRALPDDAEIDAVIITTPEFLHAEQAIAAAQAGKHVLCDKPMGGRRRQRAGTRRLVTRWGPSFISACTRWT